MTTLVIIGICAVVLLGGYAAARVADHLEDEQ